ncbi:hypothetical protein J6590_071879 [Homalodisca vitripennis]|nr:hypothetical protein J6590_071879 [Homalodisca vitripennis]
MQTSGVDDDLVFRPSGELLQSCCGNSHTRVSTSNSNRKKIAVIFFDDTMYRTPPSKLTRRIVEDHVFEGHQELEKARNCALLTNSDAKIS